MIDNKDLQNVTKYILESIFQNSDLSNDNYIGDYKFINHSVYYNYNYTISAATSSDTTESDSSGIALEITPSLLVAAIFAGIFALWFFCAGLLESKDPMPPKLSERAVIQPPRLINALEDSRAKAIEDFEIIRILRKLYKKDGSFVNLHNVLIKRKFAYDMSDIERQELEANKNKDKRGWEMIKSMIGKLFRRKKKIVEVEDNSSELGNSIADEIDVINDNLDDTYQHLTELEESQNLQHKKHQNSKNKEKTKSSKDKNPSSFVIETLRREQRDRRLAGYLSRRMPLKWKLGSEEDAPDVLRHSSPWKMTMAERQAAIESAASAKNFAELMEKIWRRFKFFMNLITFGLFEVLLQTIAITISIFAGVYQLMIRTDPNEGRRDDTDDVLTPVLRDAARIKKEFLDTGSEPLTAEAERVKFIKQNNPFDRNILADLRAWLVRERQSARFIRIWFSRKAVRFRHRILQEKQFLLAFESQKFPPFLDSETIAKMEADKLKKAADDEARRLAEKLAEDERLARLRQKQQNLQEIAEDNSSEYDEKDNDNWFRRESTGVKMAIKLAQQARLQETEEDAILKAEMESIEKKNKERTQRRLNKALGTSNGLVPVTMAEFETSGADDLIIERLLRHPTVTLADVLPPRMLASTYKENLLGSLPGEQGSSAEVDRLAKLARLQLAKEEKRMKEREKARIARNAKVIIVSTEKRTDDDVLRTMLRNRGGNGDESDHASFDSSYVDNTSDISSVSGVSSSHQGQGSEQLIDGHFSLLGAPAVTKNRNLSHNMDNDWENEGEDGYQRKLSPAELAIKQEVQEIRLLLMRGPEYIESVLGIPRANQEEYILTMKSILLKKEMALGLQKAEDVEKILAADLEKSRAPIIAALKKEDRKRQRKLEREKLRRKAEMEGRLRRAMKTEGVDDDEDEDDEVDAAEEEVNIDVNGANESLSASTLHHDDITSNTNDFSEISRRNHDYNSEIDGTDDMESSMYFGSARNLDGLPSRKSFGGSSRRLNSSSMSQSARNHKNKSMLQDVYFRQVRFKFDQNEIPDSHFITESTFVQLDEALDLEKKQEAAVKKRRKELGLGGADLDDSEILQQLEMDSGSAPANNTSNQTSYGGARTAKEIEAEIKKDVFLIPPQPIEIEATLPDTLHGDADGIFWMSLHETAKKEPSRILSMESSFPFERAARAIVSHKKIDNQNDFNTGHDTSFHLPSDILFEDNDLRQIRNKIGIFDYNHDEYSNKDIYKKGGKKNQMLDKDNEDVLTKFKAQIPDNWKSILAAPPVAQLKPSEAARAAKRGLDLTENGFVDFASEIKKHDIKLSNLSSVANEVFKDPHLLQIFKMQTQARLQKEGKALQEQEKLRAQYQTELNRKEAKAMRKKEIEEEKQDHARRLKQGFDDTFDGNATFDDSNFNADQEEDEYIEPVAPKVITESDVWRKGLIDLSKKIGIFTGIPNDEDDQNFLTSFNKHEENDRNETNLPKTIDLNGNETHLNLNSPYGRLSGNLLSSSPKNATGKDLNAFENVNADDIDLPDDLEFFKRRQAVDIRRTNQRRVNLFANDVDEVVYTVDKNLRSLSAKRAQQDIDKKYKRSGATPDSFEGAAYFDNNIDNATSQNDFTYSARPSREHASRSQLSPSVLPPLPYSFPGIQADHSEVNASLSLTSHRNKSDRKRSKKSSSRKSSSPTKENGVEHNSDFSAVISRSDATPNMKSAKADSLPLSGGSGLFDMVVSGHVNLNGAKSKTKNEETDSVSNSSNLSDKKKSKKSKKKKSKRDSSASDFDASDTRSNISSAAESGGDSSTSSKHKKKKHNSDKGSDDLNSKSNSKSSSSKKHKSRHRSDEVKDSERLKKSSSSKHMSVVSPQASHALELRSSNYMHFEDLSGNNNLKSDFDSSFDVNNSNTGLHQNQDDFDLIAICPAPFSQQYNNLIENKIPFDIQRKNNKLLVLSPSTFHQTANKYDFESGEGEEEVDITSSNKPIDGTINGEDGGVTDDESEMIRKKREEMLQFGIRESSVKLPVPFHLAYEDLHYKASRPLCNQETREKIVKFIRSIWRPRPMHVILLESLLAKGWHDTFLNDGFNGIYMRFSRKFYNCNPTSSSLMKGRLGFKKTRRPGSFNLCIQMHDDESAIEDFRGVKDVSHTFGHFEMTRSIFGDPKTQQGKLVDLILPFRFWTLAACTCNQSVKLSELIPPPMMGKDAAEDGRANKEIDGDNGDLEDGDEPMDEETLMMLKRRFATITLSFTSRFVSDDVFLASREGKQVSYMGDAVDPIEEERTQQWGNYLYDHEAFLRFVSTLPHQEELDRRKWSRMAGLESFGENDAARDANPEEDQEDEESNQQEGKTGSNLKKKKKEKKKKTGDKQNNQLEEGGKKFTVIPSSLKSSKNLNTNKDGFDFLSRQQQYIQTAFKSDRSRAEGEESLLFSPIDYIDQYGFDDTTPGMRPFFPITSATPARSARILEESVSPSRLAFRQGIRSYKPNHRAVAMQLTLCFARNDPRQLAAMKFLAREATACLNMRQVVDDALLGKRTDDGLVPFDLGADSALSRLTCTLTPFAVALKYLIVNFFSIYQTFAPNRSLLQRPRKLVTQAVGLSVAATVNVFLLPHISGTLNANMKMIGIVSSFGFNGIISIFSSLIVELILSYIAEPATPRLLSKYWVSEASNCQLDINQLTAARDGSHDVRCQIMRENEQKKRPWMPKVAKDLFNSKRTFQLTIGLGASTILLLVSLGLLIYTAFFDVYLDTSEAVSLYISDNSTSTHTVTEDEAIAALNPDAENGVKGGWLVGNAIIIVLISRIFYFPIWMSFFYYIYFRMLLIGLIPNYLGASFILKTMTWDTVLTSSNAGVVKLSASPEYQAMFPLGFDKAEYKKWLKETTSRIMKESRAEKIRREAELEEKRLFDLEVQQETERQQARLAAITSGGLNVEEQGAFGVERLTREERNRLKEEKRLEKQRKKEQRLRSPGSKKKNLATNLDEQNVDPSIVPADKRSRAASLMDEDEGRDFGGKATSEFDDIVTIGIEDTQEEEDFLTQNHGGNPRKKDFKLNSEKEGKHKKSEILDSVEDEDVIEYNGKASLAEKNESRLAKSEQNVLLEDITLRTKAKYLQELEMNQPTTLNPAGHLYVDTKARRAEFWAKLQQEGDIVKIRKSIMRARASDLFDFELARFFLNEDASNMDLSLFCPRTLKRVTLPYI